MGRRMAAAEHCRSYPKDDDAEAPVKTYPVATKASHSETLFPPNLPQRSPHPNGTPTGISREKSSSPLFRSPPTSSPKNKGEAEGVQPLRHFRGSAICTITAQHHMPRPDSITLDTTVAWAETLISALPSPYLVK
jgi:hypothetical protein